MARTTKSQSSVDGGAAACAPICIVAASVWLGHAQLGDSDLENIIEAGVALYKTMNVKGRVDVSEALNHTAFSSVVSGFKLGPAFFDTLDDHDGFRPALQHGLDSSGGGQDVAIILSTAAGTVLCMYRSASWYLFDSHGQSEIMGDASYLKRFGSLDQLGHALLLKCPIQCLGNDLDNASLNYIEAQPVMLKTTQDMKEDGAGDDLQSSKRTDQPAVEITHL